MKPYNKYKNSNIEWIGEIPEHWQVVKLKHYTNIVTGNTPSTKEDNNFSESNGVPWVKPGDLKELKPIYSSTDFLTEKGLLKARIVKKGATLIGGIGDIGKLGFAGCELTTNQQIHSIEPIENEINSRFLAYFLSLAGGELKRISSSVVVPILTKAKLLNLELIQPPKQEQTQIALYLDYKTAIIDKLIEQKKQLIQLLKKQRQATINEAVTKGLNPKATLKPSGIEWLGDIPEHWEIINLRYLGSCQNGVSKGREYFGTGFPFVNYSDVYKNRIIPSSVKGLAQSSDSDRENYSVQRGDVFFTRTSETVEEIGIASTCLKTFEDAIFTGFVIRFRPKDDSLIPEYSKYYYRSNVQRIFFVKEMNLVTRASLSQELLKRLPVLIPPQEEQVEIYQYLDQKITKFIECINKLENQIGKLKAYRQSLISEAVTGKIDLREWQAPN